MGRVAANEAFSTLLESRTRISSCVRRLFGAVSALGATQQSSEQHPSLKLLLGELRGHLLPHLAREENTLFVFVRQHASNHRTEVESLAQRHALIRETLARLEDLAAKNMVESLIFLLHHERFESAYAQHERDERALLSALATELDEAGLAELRELLEEAEYGAERP